LVSFASRLPTKRTSRAKPAAFIISLTILLKKPENKAAG
jgi:hypothetical protein